MEKNQRDYAKEYENEKKKIKRYTVRVLLPTAELLEKKAKEENKKPTDLISFAIEKYLKKN